MYNPCSCLSHEWWNQLVASIWFWLRDHIRIRQSTIFFPNLYVLVLEVSKNHCTCPFMYSRTNKFSKKSLFCTDFLGERCTGRLEFPGQNEAKKLSGEFPGHRWEFQPRGMSGEFQPPCTCTFCTRLKGILFCTCTLSISGSHWILRCENMKVYGNFYCKLDRLTIPQIQKLISQTRFFPFLENCRTLPLELNPTSSKNRSELRKA